MITSGYRNGSFIIGTALTFEKEFREMIPNTKFRSVKGIFETALTFEKEFREMIRNTKFRSVKGIFENKLKEDISKNKTSLNVFVFVNIKNCLKHHLNYKYH